MTNTTESFNAKAATTEIRNLLKQYVAYIHDHRAAAAVMATTARAFELAADALGNIFLECRKLETQAADAIDKNNSEALGMIVVKIDALMVAMHERAQQRAAASEALTAATEEERRCRAQVQKAAACIRDFYKITFGIEANAGSRL